MHQWRSQLEEKKQKKKWESGRKTCVRLFCQTPQSWSQKVLVSRWTRWKPHFTFHTLTSAAFWALLWQHLVAGPDTLGMCGWCECIQLFPPKKTPACLFPGTVSFHYQKYQPLCVSEAKLSLNLVGRQHSQHPSLTVPTRGSGQVAGRMPSSSTPLWKIPTCLNGQMSDVWQAGPSDFPAEFHHVSLPDKNSSCLPSACFPLAVPPFNRSPNDKSRPAALTKITNEVWSSDASALAALPQRSLQGVYWLITAVLVMPYSEPLYFPISALSFFLTFFFLSPSCLQRQIVN